MFAALAIGALRLRSDDSTMSAVDLAREIVIQVCQVLHIYCGWNAILARVLWPPVLSKY